MVVSLVYAVVISSHRSSVVMVMFAFVSFRVGSLLRLCYCLFFYLFGGKRVDVINWCCCFVSMAMFLLESRRGCCDWSRCVLVLSEGPSFQSVSFA